jgi:hypothetical protein
MPLQKTFSSRALLLPDGTRFAQAGAAISSLLVLTVTVSTRQRSDSYFNTCFP